MLRNLPYLILQGFKNIFRHKAASAFSLAVMVATILIYSGSCALLLNLNAVVKETQESVGITVFFDDDLTEEEILKLGARIESNSDEEIRRMVYTSAAEAWENFKKIYFAENEELAEGFIEDNPLAKSSSYEIFLNDISHQQEFVRYLESIKGVRKVNYSNTAEGLSRLGKLVEIITIVILATLLTVSVVLIGNSISLAIAMRKDEIAVMRYVGATDAFIRFPFVMQGTLIGLLGAGLPLALVCGFYQTLVDKASEELESFGDTIHLLAQEAVFPILIPVGLGLGVGLGLLASLVSLRRHLKA